MVLGLPGDAGIVAHRHLPDLASGHLDESGNETVHPRRYL